MQKINRIPSKYSETVKKKIETICEKSIEVRFEKGSFKTSDCVVDNRKILIINKSLPNEHVDKYLETYISDLERV